DQASHVRIEVADSGPGLPAAIMERLFDPWVTTKPAGQGSGLGLAIVRDVVRSHGGTVPGYNGAARAVFVIDLPAAGSPGTPARAMRRILVVDDDGETCRFLEELLEAPDRLFVSVQDPEAAISRIRHEPFDLLISDINLNNPRSGLDLLRRF